ncbi:Allophanate hydrolase 2 subunit 1 [Labilithrix luteola]|uniref:Allophanate hydrolase 2 subunit 1 n=1 Tax=Labilithrix luteola TaxID=1391654 RepID=A0A0K1QEP5_9BACT|nr:carboxyltransferase domain-containing protein [Labilithrix luteola]AKV04224.1 Allophanate hydrolase 2 subunit 1 [Labilithrix luteola]
MTIELLGDRALRFALPAGADRRALLDDLRSLPGVRDVVLTEARGAVVLSAPQERAAIETAIAARLVSTRAGSHRASAEHRIEVIYDGEDLAALAETLHVGVDDVVAMHAGRDYDVAMLGFLPGFAYLRGLDPRLVVPRRSSPRPRVPEGSLAIAAGYTGIYPFASPGGWLLLGRALDHAAFDERGATLALGDRVRFVPVPARASRPRTPPAAPAPPTGAYLEVGRALGPAILVDGGRPGHMHEGVPAGGALVAGALARANASLGNDDGACGVEIFGSLEVVARGGGVAIADDERGARLLAEGEAAVLGTEGRARARYLAVAGGFDVPLFLGGRGTLPVAKVGGFEGRPLKRGDRLAPRLEAPARIEALSPARPLERAIRVRIGPDDVPAPVVDALLATTFTIAPASDRTGVRLVGPTLPSAEFPSDRPSGPMVHGVIELTPSGPIVLGPDHPTTGGYPIIAVVCHDSLDAFFGQPVGSPVTFVRHG